MEMNNYYTLLKLKYEFTPFRLLKNYLKETKKALNAGAYDEFVVIRQGFEVLRSEEAKKCYNKIFRKYILKQDLNYPKLKEQDMIKSFQDKEHETQRITEKIKLRKDSYLSHLCILILEIIISDVSMILVLGASGLLFISIGLYCLIAFYDNDTNIIGGIMSVCFGLFFLRRNIIAYIEEP
jgi:hypothetical protein